MTITDKFTQPLTIVSNRLPVSASRQTDGSWQLVESNGGLIKALDPILRQRGGCWVGWNGSTECRRGDIADALKERAQQTGYSLQSVPLDDAEVEGFYSGFSNRCIWPLFHNLLGNCTFDADHWLEYNRVNEKFARNLLALESNHGFIWVHDYHLMLTAQKLRKMGIDTPISFFLHIPFPPAETFMSLPWRKEIIEALLHFDLIGFQTDQDRENFLDCAHQLAGTNRSQAGDTLTCLHHQLVDVKGAKNGHYNLCHVGTFPISVDYQSLDTLARQQDVEDFCEHLKQGIHGRKLLFGADRLDYSKGLLQRMKAYQRLLRDYPSLHNNVSFVQYVVPGRETVPEYRDLHEDIERLVGEINGEFTQPGWVPLHYIYRKLNTEQLAGYYRAADVALVTPVKDGMNLVAKEYCASRVDDDGVLVLSDFAGAARELSHSAVVVNPYDEQGFAEALYHACTMPAQHRAARMQRLRQTVCNWNIYHWVDAFISAIPERRHQLSSPPIRMSCADTEWRGGMSSSY